MLANLKSPTGNQKEKAIGGLMLFEEMSFYEDGLYGI